jgi:hypothetical protein
LDQINRERVFKELNTTESAKDYSYLGFISQIVRHLNKEETIKIFDNTLTNCPKNRLYNEDCFLELVKKSYDFDSVYVKNIIMGRTDDTYDKAILLFDNITPDEEVRGLRALGQRKFCSRIIQQYKYSPTKDAITKLPPVFRLKVLETLSHNRHLSYNIFKHFPDPDEFKSLMFSSVLRHRERAEAVWNKYQEIAFLGKDAEIKIKTNCSNCGEFEVVVNSKRVRTKTGLMATNLWNQFRYGCVLCGNHEKTMEIVEKNVS